MHYILHYHFHCTFQCLKVDPDALREMLPETEGYIKRDPNTAGYLTQKEVNCICEVGLIAVFDCMYVCVCVFVFVCICVRLRVVCVFVYARSRARVCVYLCMCMCMCKYAHTLYSLLLRSSPLLSSVFFSCSILPYLILLYPTQPHYLYR